MPLSIFISYARVDHDRAYALVGRLANAGIDAFVDEWSIEIGSKWRTAICKALDACTGVVVVCTQASVVSKEVLFELAYAMGLGKPVIPVLYQSGDLPPFLAELQGLDFTQQSKWDQLLTQVKALTDVRHDAAADCQREGLLRMGASRSERERGDFIHEVLDSAKRGTTITVVGRSLIDWALLWEVIQARISERHLNVKLALIDETTLYNRSGNGQDHRLGSWIESPVPSDWAILDVPQSMNKLRTIVVSPNTGSLTIYGLPFYPTHSFVSFTKESDGRFYCLEEAGIASPKGRRPFLEFCRPSARDSYPSILGSINDAFLTDDRLLLFDDGQRRTMADERLARGRIIADKVDSLGLVDIAVGHGGLDWSRATITDRIDQTPQNGEIFILGRSVVTWTNHWQHLAKAILHRGIRCTFVLADRETRSLVQGDFAQRDVPTCWDIFDQDLAPDLRKNWSNRSGMFMVYGIPCYVPATFASYTGAGGRLFCSLEVGIGVGPEDRPVLYFQRVSDGDAYSHLNKIHRSILIGRSPVIKVP